MNRNELLALYDRNERRDALIPGFRREQTPLIVRHISADGGGMLVYSHLTADNADAVIAAEIAYWRELGNGFEWKLYSHDQPADLGERLAAHGFSAGEDEAIMALDLAALPAPLAQTPPITIRRITDPNELDDVRTVEAAVWQRDASAWSDRLATQLRATPDFISVYVAYVDAVPVCAARINFPANSPFASLWGGATLPAYRGRGIYTALVAVRAQEAVQRGYRFLTIDASAMSRPIVAKYGFQLLTMSQPCDWGKNNSG